MVFDPPFSIPLSLKRSARVTWIAGVVLGTTCARAPAAPVGANAADGTQRNRTQTAPTSPAESFFGRYQARVTATQSQQPHWITPLVTVTPRLEQEVRTDFVHSYNSKRFAIWNYGNGKGLEFIPERHTEVLLNLPPFFNRSNGESDGFGDVTFLLKERLYARNEQHGNSIVTVFLGGSVPSGKNGNGLCCATITPTLAVGKGFANFDVNSTAGGVLPISGVKTLGRTVVWNTAAQYHLGKQGIRRFLWPEVESNSSFFFGGTNDGKTQSFVTPGLVAGRIPLTRAPEGRLGLTLGVGEQIAVTHFHTANHLTVLTVRVPF